MYEGILKSGFSISGMVKNINLKRGKSLKEKLRKGLIFQKRPEGLKMGELSKLPNIGKVLEKQLNDVGIGTVDDLINIGSKEAWLRIKEVDESACINRLMALEGAIQNVRWHNLSEEDKKNLKDFYTLQKREL